MLVSKLPAGDKIDNEVLALVRAHELKLYHRYDVGFTCKSASVLWNELIEMYNLISTSSGTGKQSGIFTDNPELGKEKLVIAVDLSRAAYITAHSDNLVRSATVCESLRVKHLMPLPEPETDEEIEIRFWHQTPMGPKSFSKWVLFPKLEEIENNYPIEVRDQLKSLMAKKPRQPSGMILWTGPPGGGKTTALRALAKEWDEWCDVQIIADPEKLLNDMSYLYSVATAGYKDATLIVLEDSGELIAHDAKKASGQALSRLLNITDGILGQGLNCYFLITTNEQVGALHEAAARPGRALPNGNSNFSKLPVKDANAWCKTHKIKYRVTEPTSLAELYHALAQESPADEDNEPEAKKKRVVREQDEAMDFEEACN